MRFDLICVLQRSISCGCREKVKIKSTKGPITLQGSGMKKTKVTYDQDSTEAGGTMLSASVSVSSDNFICKDIAFEVSPDVHALVLP